MLLCGGGLGNAVLFSIGKKARELGNRVIYFAGYKKAEDFYKREELEEAADVLILSVDRGRAHPRPAADGPSASWATSSRRCSPTRREGSATRGDPALARSTA